MLQSQTQSTQTPMGGKKMLTNSRKMQTSRRKLHQIPHYTLAVNGGVPVVRYIGEYGIVCRRVVAPLIAVMLSKSRANDPVCLDVHGGQQGWYDDSDVVTEFIKDAGYSHAAVIGTGRKVTLRVADAVIAIDCSNMADPLECFQRKTNGRLQLTAPFCPVDGSDINDDFPFY